MDFTVQIMFSEQYALVENCPKNASCYTESVIKLSGTSCCHRASSHLWTPTPGERWRRLSNMNHHHSCPASLQRMELNSFRIHFISILICLYLNTSFDMSSQGLVLSQELTCGSILLACSVQDH